ncbi:MAG: hypothetical protein SGJ27_19815 [Candidatus Melainabacteria bacterium]|nr:hypothetical protein [Candidatus Melainabacteria bacterium]
MKVSEIGKLLVLATVLIPIFQDCADARWEKDGDITAYRLQLKDRIELGQQWGDLNSAEAVRLQEDLKELSRLERRSSRSGLSDREKRNIWTELEKLDNRITAQLRDRDRTGWRRNWDRNKDGLGFWQTRHKKLNYSAFETRLHTISAKTASGITSGQLNRDESVYLNDETTRLRGILSRAKQAGGMPADEVGDFEHMIAKLNERLERSLQSPASSKWNSGNWHHGWRNSKHPPNPSSPPRWSVSKDGYVDLTGQVHGTIPGNELYRYGGTMKDGRRAPTTPHVNINTSGHISW